MKSLKSFIGHTHILRLTYHRLRGHLAAFLAGYPARTLTVTAITGTDGKTTTVSMITHILRSCGKKVAAASTAYLDIDGTRVPNATQKTSLSASDIQRFLRKVARAKCEHVVLEASSHGLLQGRLAGISITVAGVTNVTMEHLDYHGTMKEYIRAKSLLFQALRKQGTKVINADDVSYDCFSRIPSASTIAYSPSVQLSRIQSLGSAVSATLTYDNVEYHLSLPISGTFNLSNALCAICCTSALGIPVSSSVQSLTTFIAPSGRMERIDRGQTFHVFVDFTVTPVAYERTLDSLRGSLSEGGRLIVVTGSCGDRMPEKRPLVGAICSRKADIVIVTNEDPYTEDPEKIIDEVISGVTDMMRYQSEHDFKADPHPPDRYCIRVSDRMDAITLALSLARTGDSVIFCGKGADITMMTASGQIPWHEKELVERAIDAQLLLRRTNASNPTPASSTGTV